MVLGCIHETGGGGSISHMLFCQLCSDCKKMLSDPHFPASLYCWEGKKNNPENPIHKDLCPIKPFLPALD